MGLHDPFSWISTVTFNAEILILFYNMRRAIKPCLNAAKIPRSKCEPFACSYVFGKRTLGVCLIFNLTLQEAKIFVMRKIASSKNYIYYDYKVMAIYECNDLP